MNSKGIFSAALLLFFIALTVKAGGLETSFSKETSKTQRMLLEIEKNSFLRTELETNTDFLIKQSVFLASTINPENEFVKEFTASNMDRFILMTKELRGNKTDFFLENKNTLEKSGFSKEAFKELTNIMVLRGKNFYEAEFNFTGGINKDRVFGAQIKSQNSSLDFFITPGYKSKILGITLR